MELLWIQTSRKTDHKTLIMIMRKYLIYIVINLLALFQVFADLTAALSDLPRWRSDRVFTAEEWQKLSKAADEFRLSTEQLECKRWFPVRNCMHRRLRTGKVIQLLVYMYFSVSFLTSKMNLLNTGKGWIGQKQGQRIWPLAIDHAGKIDLASLYRGSMGPPYKPIREYQVWSKNFKIRSSNPVPAGKEGEEGR